MSPVPLNFITKLPVFVESVEGREVKSYFGIRPPTAERKYSTFSSFLIISAASFTAFSVRRISYKLSVSIFTSNSILSEFGTSSKSRRDIK